MHTDPARLLGQALARMVSSAVAGQVLKVLDRVFFKLSSS